MNIKSFTKEETNQTGKLPGSIKIHGKKMNQEMQHSIEIKLET